MQIMLLLKYRNIFSKDCVSNLSEEVFVIKKVKNSVPWTCVTNDFNVIEIETFCEKRLQKKTTTRV